MQGQGAGGPAFERVRWLTKIATPKRGVRDLSFSSMKGVLVMQVRIGLIATVVAAVFGSLCSTAFAVTPGWECVPTTAGQAVTSGGTGTSPSCGSSSTAVLAPTYVSDSAGYATAQFSGVNLQVVNGATGTNPQTTANGKGNLIIGYDPSPGAQSGSHNLVLGSGQTDIATGGIVAGWKNTISVDGASVLGGQGNFAKGFNTSISSGSGNTTVDPNSGILGGCDNLTSQTGSVQVASCFGFDETISGGAQNQATGLNSSVTGGCDNLAGSGTTPSNACTNTGQETVLSGSQNQAKGANSSVSGGKFNLASDLFASVAGGCDNLAGPGTTPTNACSSTGIETVSGGAGNAASGNVSSVSGGTSNIAGGPGSSASGGWQNTASGESSWVGGGHNNNPSGWAGSISGGESNTVSNSLGSILGGFGNGVSSNCGTFPPTGQSC